MKLITSGNTYKDWKKIRCYNCGGYGMKAGFGNEPYECYECVGNGILWVTPNLRVVAYPTGPFRGSMTKEEYEKL